MAQVSVIVQINSENDLRETLDSITTQTLSDIEIICINNCVDEKVQGILSEYIKKDSRIKSLKELEIDNMGDCLMLIAPHEKLNPKGCQLAYDTITKESADIVISNKNICPEGKHSVYPLCKRLGAYWTVICPELYEKNADFFNICNTKICILNKKFLKENSIRLSFDFNFLAQVLVKASKISVTKNNIFEAQAKENLFENKTLCAEEKENIIQNALNLKYNNNYEKTISRLKNTKTLRVLFLVNEISKWKAQALYDEMEKSARFEPLIILTISDIQFEYNKEQKKTVLNNNLNFFKNKNMKCFIGYDIENEKAIDLAEFEPDIVFYEQPYNMDWLQDVPSVSKYALTCYFPYYIASYKNLPLDCGRFFHNGLFRFYVLNEEFRKEYSSYMKNKGSNLKVAGHPTLDLIQFDNKKPTKDNLVIYAPHWSIKHANNHNDICISTFLEYGEIMLNYAKEHPEINWAFKPHPTLKSALEKIWGSKKRVEKYYSEWEKIADCCYTSDYIELFKCSRLLITDCNSFLIEYFSTGKPVIHLISDDTKLEPYEYNKKIMETFYKIKNQNDLYLNLEKLIINCEDSMKQARLDLLNKYGFINNNCAKQIIDDINSIIKQN